MSQSLASSAATTPDNSDVFPRPKQAKANLVTTHDNGEADSLSPVVKEAAKVTYGKQGAAAAKLKKNEGNFSRDIDAERTTIAELRELGPAFLAEMGRRLVTQYGPLSSPHARAMFILSEMSALHHELAQLIDCYVEKSA